MENRRYLSVLDNGFLITETKNSPKHIAGLQIYQKPINAPKNFVKNLSERWSKEDDACAPYNLKLNAQNPLSPYWTECDSFKASNHVEFLSLKKGSRGELYTLISELHEANLDRSKPMWRCVFVDGLTKDRFAIYFSFHHSVSDGVSAGKIMERSLSTDAAETGRPPFWAMKDNLYNKKSSRPKPTLMNKLIGAATGNAKTAYGLSRISTQLCLEAMGLTKNAISLPFTSAISPLTGSVTSKRSFTTASLPLDRVNHLRKITRNTLNHIALTCLDGAIHRYLDHIGNPLNATLTITMPVSLRKEDAKVGGNQIGLVTTKLSPKTDDPFIRLREIGVSLQAVRHQIDESPAASIQAYSLVTNGLSQLADTANVAGLVPPLSHTIVSNVPGPKNALYLEGAELLGWYPVSTLGPGHRLNVTMFSYNGKLDFGIIAASDFLPDLNVLGRFIYEEFEELEKVVMSPDMGTEFLAAKRLSVKS
ncbi:wax ester/triacylglycerol synthase family O-acyltransferase [Alkalimarinus alittae]|uniref:diacylglycerol O-acyltransferase n=1 Tax=Alkalimarinus alittae TaxID=2961619 RepID=A0ABY6MY57_9ALTE|nr:wax ester/triacylglycerol synthase family O-acyltransferase [Alkalimarinus alittae]UZE94773.1 wax ester/triacylglycerol synthase family O-acyltransferase [Alkalimarinus alittae]